MSQHSPRPPLLQRSTSNSEVGPAIRTVHRTPSDPTSYGKAWVFRVQSNKFQKVNKTAIIDEKGQLQPGIQVAKVPLLKNRLKIVLNGTSETEPSVTYGVVRIPKKVRGARLIGRCQNMYISAAA